jgi:hypothetical protein
VDGEQPVGTERRLSSPPRRDIGFVAAQGVAIVRPVAKPRREDDMAKKKGKKDKGKKGKKK